MFAWNELLSRHVKNYMIYFIFIFGLLCFYFVFVVYRNGCKAPFASVSTCLSNSSVLQKVQEGAVFNSNCNSGLLSLEHYSQHVHPLQHFYQKCQKALFLFGIVT